MNGKTFFLPSRHIILSAFLIISTTIKSLMYLHKFMQFIKLLCIEELSKQRFDICQRSLNRPTRTHKSKVWFDDSDSDSEDDVLQLHLMIFRASLT